MSTTNAPIRRGKAVTLTLDPAVEAELRTIDLGQKTIGLKESVLLVEAMARREEKQRVLAELAAQAQQ